MTMKHTTSKHLALPQKRPLEIMRHADHDWWTRSEVLAETTSLDTSTSGI